MVFIIVQWENENTVNIVNEKQAIGAVELEEERQQLNNHISHNLGRAAIEKR